VDASGLGALVGCALSWYRDIHALVCARFVPRVATGCVIRRKTVGIHTGLAWFYVEREWNKTRIKLVYVIGNRKGSDKVPAWVERRMAYG